MTIGTEVIGYSQKLIENLYYKYAHGQG